MRNSDIQDIGDFESLIRISTMEECNVCSNKETFFKQDANADIRVV